MLVIANGAGKCGSTWLACIILELVQPRTLPASYHDTRHGSIPTIKGNMIEKFLNEVDYQHENYVSKNHFYYERHLLSRYKHVYVVDIVRDLPDMLISLFFHATPRMAHASVEEVRKAYWRYGPMIVEYVARYHAIWGQPCRWTYTSSYQQLKENPTSEIAAIAAFLGIAVTPERIERIIDNTEFHRLAEKLSSIDGMQRRFRKGVIGDHKNYLDSRIVEDIRRIEARNSRYPRTLVEKAAFALQCYRRGGHNSPPPYDTRLDLRSRPVEELYG
jgi:hypothetical protein